MVGGAIKVVGVLVVVVNGGAGAAVVGLAVGALGGAGGAGAGVDSVVAGPGCSFCGDWLAWPPTRTTVATMTMNAATMAAPIIVRPPSVLNHGVVFGSGSVSVISRSASLADLGIVRRPPDGGDLKRTRDEARIHRSSHDGYQHLSRPGVIRRGNRAHDRADLIAARISSSVPCPPVAPVRDAADGLASRDARVGSDPVAAPSTPRSWSAPNRRRWA